MIEAWHTVGVSVLADALKIDSLALPLPRALDIVVANALHHGPAGRRGGLVRLDATARQDAARISAEGDGCGISRTVLECALAPFFNAQMGMHTGQGLTILHNADTDMLGGERVQ